MFSIIELIANLLGLLLIAVLTLATCKRLILPVSVALILMGILLNQFHLPSLFLNEIIATEDFSNAREEFEQIVSYIILPTLIFEAAFKWDARPLRYTLLPISLLTMLGFFSFAVLMGLLLEFFTPLTFPQALLLAVLLSATDFNLLGNLLKRLSVPKRFLTLIQGESLFNNATAMVAAKSLFALVIIDSFPLSTLWEQWEIFVWQMTGGLLIGWLAAWGTSYLLKQVERDTFMEISLTLILVYGTYLLTEEWLQLSGIMATIAAGLTLSRYSPPTVPQTSHSAPISSATPPLAKFWEYLAHLSAALIFLITGLTIDLSVTTSFQIWELLGMTLLILLFTRALVVYGILPLLAWFPHQKHLGWHSYTLMYWGSLRGAVSLAILFGLGYFPHHDTFLVLVTFLILFSSLVQGLTLPALIQKLGLDQPSLIDRFLRLEGMLTAQQRAFSRIPEFQQGGLFSARLAERECQHYEHSIRETRQSLSALREQALDPGTEQRLLFLRVFATEKTLYQEMFIKGHLSERAYRNLTYSIDLQSEAIRHEGHLLKFTLHFQGPFSLSKLLWRVMEHLPKGRRWVSHLRALRTASDYEEAWGRHQGNLYILSRLDEIASRHQIRPHIVEKIRSHYRRWHDSARARIDNTTEHFAEFVTAMQEKLAERLILHAQREALSEQAQAGFLPAGLAYAMIDELSIQFYPHNATWDAIAHLRLEPLHLLRNVAFFKNISVEECSTKILPYLHSHTRSANDILVKEGDRNDSLFLIAYGVVRVSRLSNGQDLDVATLMAGDFLGDEMLSGLQHYHTTSYRAVTPCSLYELRREDFEKVRAMCLARGARH